MKKISNFKVEIRKNCKICGEPLGFRQRTFCGKTCRNRSYAIRHRDSRTAWQRARRDKIASEPSDKKCQCLICGKWYVQVCSHVFQVHKITARKYKEYMDLEVKKGIVPAWYRKLKGDIAIENGTYKNIIETGKKFRFKVGDPGIGKYHRSHITMERLSNLHKFNKHNKTI